jgi:hypothetical protein
MTFRSKAQKRAVGDIVRIDLGDGFHAYARVLEEALFAFYDSRLSEELPVDRIVALPILFQIPVMDYAVRRARWVIVGSAPLEDGLSNPRPRFMQDAIRKDEFRIYQSGRIRPATKQECIGLEREAVWDPTHVEDRLRDHYAGRRNKWVESLRIKE